jgi:hypothetical protein
MATALPLGMVCIGLILRLCFLLRSFSLVPLEAHAFPRDNHAAMRLLSSASFCLNFLAFLDSCSNGMIPGLKIMKCEKSCIAGLASYVAGRDVTKYSQPFDPCS